MSAEHDLRLAPAHHQIHRNTAAIGTVARHRRNLEGLHTTTRAGHPLRKEVRKAPLPSGSGLNIKHFDEKFRVHNPVIDA